jgi:hypothetical protein
VHLYLHEGREEMNGIFGVGRRVLAYGLVTAGLAGALLQVSPGLEMLAAGLVCLAFDYAVTRPQRQRSRAVRHWYIR